MISKLTEEEHTAIQQNQKLRQELDLLREKRNVRHGGFSITFVVVVVGLVGALVGVDLNRDSNLELALQLPKGVGGTPETGSLLLAELDIGDAEDAAATELGRQAEEDLLVFRNAVESLGEQRDGMDAVLIAKKGSGEAGHRVADSPRCVALEADHLVRALHHGLPDPL
ncbi:hypothetical protein MUK42_10683 [Musa troglodytarum]|uniref:Uncharacterized protein n=1 Tax=Musa troglodytarum TaxID=320322 RepID=A0A9E7KBY6_9LILI|nr:hypothetical protein MUK42_10683 [Musa troglodytarum]